MLIIGHRGAKGLALENTKESFQAALDNQAGAIELDVRSSSDGLTVVLHDDKIKPKGKVLEVVNTDYITLQKYMPRLLTLAEALDFIAGRVPVIIEVKPECDISPVLKTIEHAVRWGWNDDDISISSFSIEILEKFKNVMPDRRLIVNEKWSGLRAVKRAKLLETEYITMNQRWLWTWFIKSLSKKGYKLSAYTLNNPKKAAKWSNAGLDGVITDYPDRFNHQ